MPDQPKQDAELHAVHGGDFFHAIGEDFGDLHRHEDVIAADVLDAWYEPAPGVLQTLREHLAWLIKTSPPTHGEGLLKVISEVRHINEDCLVIGAGTSSLMYLGMPRFLCGGENAVVLDPTYGEYAHIFEKILGMSLKRVPVDPEKDFHPDVEAVASAAMGAAIAALVNPNSPTGASLTIDELQYLLGSLDKETWLWVDETYVDFDPNCPTLEHLTEDHPKLIVSKSMSKYYALSGLRVGYLSCHPDLARRLRAISPPWPVGLLAQAAAVKALQDPAYYAAKARRTAELRAVLSAGLRQIPGIRPYPSTTNFVLMQLSGVTSRVLAARARREGVFLRDCDSLSAWFEGRFVRTCVLSSTSNAKIVMAIERAMGSS